MPEGPSILIAREQLEQFTGKKITAASGSAGIDFKRIRGNTINAITTWGKHLLFCFDGFSIRIHFLMFGKYFINSSKALKPRLHLEFGKHRELNIYTSAVTLIEGSLNEVYDWTADVMHDSWDEKAAKKKLKAIPDMLIADAIVEQHIFSGVGNIMKNEVLYRTRVHPESITGKIPPARITAIIREIRKYAFEFLAWRRAEKLASHWEAYKQKICVRDGSPLRKEYIGKSKRGTFFCDKCQEKFV